MQLLTRIVAIAVLAVVALPVRATSVVLQPILIELVTPGGPLPVNASLYVPGPGLSSTGLSGRIPTEPVLQLVNGEETLRPDSLRVRSYAIPGGRREVLEAEFGDNVVRWEVTNQNGERFGIGEYVVQRRESVHTMPLTVRTLHEDKRFDVVSTPPGHLKDARRFGGRWDVDFESDDNPSVGVFEVDERTGRATGTFLNATGDYRFLEGRVDGRAMRLSAFDGQHAFLFNATLEGDRLTGNFWSGNWWHETWTAQRNANAADPDGFDQTVATVDYLTPVMLREMDFAVARSGRNGASTVFDALVPGEPRLLYIFGTWCPNCRDATETVREFDDRYGDRLKVAAFAFENDPERGVPLARAYAERNALEFPVFAAGFSDKALASEKVPFLDKIRSFPTLVFIGRDGKIEAVHSGWSGPATGRAYRDQNAAIETAVRRIVR
ncbi:MAG: TlpA family protein disulfide reductase [Planctomycetota bacterium]